MSRCLEFTHRRQPAKSVSQHATCSILGIQFEALQVKPWQVEDSRFDLLAVGYVVPKADEEGPEDDVVDQGSSADLPSTADATVGCVVNAHRG